ncbi:hypothetical protein MKFW12EY_43480 [Methylomonas koyamae]|nr:hypothetical protein MKFW12EY_43480 [Methylomonas koyamae]
METGGRPGRIFPPLSRLFGLFNRYGIAGRRRSGNGGRAAGSPYKPSKMLFFFSA